MSDVFLADSGAPVVLLSAKKHFDALPTDKEKKYAHFLSRAAHHGTRAILRSVSPESEDIYDLILAIHKALDSPSSNEKYIERWGAKLKDQLLDTTDAVTKYLEYASQFLSNVGNYKSFGDKKFVPRIPESQLDTLIAQLNDAKVGSLYEKIKQPLYDSNEKKGLLGWPAQGHMSGYYPGSNEGKGTEKTITKDEVELVNAALATHGIMPENTRVEKVDDKKFLVHVASALDENATSYYPKEPITYESATITFSFGDHKNEFKKIVEALEEASKYVANDTQAKMLYYYIESFKTGSMNAHKESQVQWVKDLKPLVESNIGFIETYRDPSGVRGEWEGLIAMVNQDRTAKFSTLVENATTLIKHLPWDPFFEKDKFTPPDFTSLEVLTFAGSGVPAGINIPNYDDVRLNVGFKNVSLGNVLSANPKKPKKEEVITFLSPELQQKFRKWRDEAFEVQVGLHELLGHGTGKLLQETAPGKFNFDRSNKLASSYYGPNDTWGSLFGTVAGSFEECRAELVALYLILKEPSEVFDIFGIKDSKDQEDVILIATVLMCRAGLLGLEFWDPATKKWGQPHMQARFGIFKSLHKAGICDLKYKEENFDDLEIVFDTSKLSTTAVDTLGEYLRNLHVFKSTGNVKEGQQYYNEQTEVTPEYSKFRDVVLAKKLPRKQLIQANTVLTESGSVEVKEYEESEVGLILSFVERGV